MSNYRVILLDAADSSPEGRQKLKENMVSRLRLSPERVEELLLRLPVTLKSNLSISQAQSYNDTLVALGAAVKLETLAPEPISTLSNAQEKPLEFDPPEERISGQAETLMNEAGAEEDKPVQIENVQASVQDLEGLLDQLLLADDDQELIFDSPPELDKAENKVTSANDYQDGEQTSINYTQKELINEETEDNFSLDFSFTGPIEEELENAKTPSQKANFSESSEDLSQVSQTDEIALDAMLDKFGSSGIDTSNLEVPELSSANAETQENKAKLEPSPFKTLSSKEPSSEEGPLAAVAFETAKKPLSAKSLALLFGAAILVVTLLGFILLNPSDRANRPSQPSKEEIMALLENQGEILGKPQPDLKAVEHKPVVRKWQGSIQDDGFTVEAWATTEDKKVVDFQLNIQSKPAAPLTPQELVDKISRPWLADFTAKIDVPGPKPKLESQVEKTSWRQSLTGSGRCYIRDAEDRLRTVANLKINIPAEQEDGTLKGSWEISKGEEAKSEENLTVGIKRLPKNDFQIKLRGGFVAETKSLP